jgi:hypothetical protein
MDKERLQNYLEGRDMDDLVFQVTDLYSREVIVWNIDDVLYEINRDTSSEWSEYTVEDWVDGWAEWCEGDVYTMYSIVDSKDGDVLNKPFAYVNPTYANGLIHGVFSNDNLNLNASDIMDMEDPIIKTEDIDIKETYVLQIGQVPYFYANREDRDSDYAKVTDVFLIIKKNN